MRGLNKVMLIGNAGNDPEMTQKNDLLIAKFSLATNEKWRDRNGSKPEKTEWHNIVAFRRLAEVCCEYLKKGKPVYIEGKLKYHVWKDDQGIKKYMTEIIASNIILLSP